MGKPLYSIVSQGNGANGAFLTSAPATIRVYNPAFNLIDQRSLWLDVTPTTNYSLSNVITVGNGSDDFYVGL